MAEAKTGALNRAQGILVDRRSAAGLLVAGYALIACYLGLVLRFDFYWTDAGSYWADSLSWQQPFDAFHVPGYPLAIALLRGLTFGRLPPLILMMGMGLTAFVVSALLVYNLIRAAGLGERYAVLGMLAFGLWPFVGLTYAVAPLADLLAAMLYLGGLYALFRPRLFVAAALLGLSLIVHKAMWPFVALTVVARLSQRRERLTWREPVALGLLLLPLGALWAAGAIHHGSLTWLVANNLQVEVASRGALPVLDGIAGSFLNEGWIGVAKGAAITLLAAVAAMLACSCWRAGTRDGRYGLAIAAAVLVLCLILNEHEIWAAVRFSRLLVLPLMWRIGRRGWAPSLAVRAVGVASLLVAGLLASQFAFAWYMARVFEWTL